jgi:hypothetical protein
MTEILLGVLEVVAIILIGACVLAMMGTTTLAPSGGWRRCESCEFIGPDPSGFHTDALAFHRAMHHAGRTYVEELGGLRGLVVWLNRRLARGRP